MQTSPSASLGTQVRIPRTASGRPADAPRPASIVYTTSWQRYLDRLRRLVRAK